MALAEFYKSLQSLDKLRLALDDPDFDYKEDFENAKRLADEAWRIAVDERRRLTSEEVKRFVEEYPGTKTLVDALTKAARELDKTQNQREINSLKTQLEIAALKKQLKKKQLKEQQRKEIEELKKQLVAKKK